MIVDKTYWGSDLPLPLSPSDSDVEIYKRYLKEGTTLMLGCTKKLLPLSDKQLDLDPWYNGETVIVGDWVNNVDFYNNIIIDGGLCFNKKLCNDIVKMASNNCEIFISRSIAIFASSAELEKQCNKAGNLQFFCSLFKISIIILSALRLCIINGNPVF